ncbi:MAG: FecR domain-containing protein [Marinifilaceae bacterium]
MIDSIWDIIARVIRKEDVSSKENSFFEKWCNSSNVNRRIYHRIDSCVNQLSMDKPSYKIDVDKAFYRNKLRIQIKEKKKRSVFFDFIVYAASIILVFSSVLFFTNQLKNNYKVVKFSNAVIKKNEAKSVILQFNDNCEVKLNSNSSKTIIKEKLGALITNDGTVIKYNVDNSKVLKLKYNKLLIPRGVKYKLVLSDGTKVWLNSKSSLKFPVVFGEEVRMVFLEGEAFFEVTSDKNRPFIVNSKNVKTRVFGTSFNVSSYGNSVLTTLLEGSVLIEDEFKKSLFLIPGEQSIYDIDNHTVVKKKVDVSLFTSWKDGYFKFHNEKLENIMISISRWYDINVVYVDAEVKDIRYSGKIMLNRDIYDFLGMLEITNDICFEIKKNSVVVSKKTKSHK